MEFIKKIRRWVFSGSPYRDSSVMSDARLCLGEELIGKVSMQNHLWEEKNICSLEAPESVQSNGWCRKVEIEWGNHALSNRVQEAV